MWSYSCPFNLDMTFKLACLTLNTDGAGEREEVREGQREGENPADSGSVGCLCGCSDNIPEGGHSVGGGLSDSIAMWCHT